MAVISALPALVEALIAVAGGAVLGVVGATVKAVMNRLRPEARRPTAHVIIEVEGERTEMTGPVDEVERSVHEKLSQASQTAS